MNKIILDNNKPFYLEIKNKEEYNVIVFSEVDAKLVILGNSDYDINYTLQENSSLLVNSLNKDNKTNIKLDLQENSTIVYNHSVLGKNNSENVFTINHLASNTGSILNNNGINYGNGNLFFQIDGVIKQNLVNINCNQNSKIINFNHGNSKIIPNLIIDSNDIVANHSAYIGEIKEEEKFYFQSRGIDEERIKEIIYQAVLLGKMDLLEEKELFNRKIKEWW